MADPSPASDAKAALRRRLRRARRDFVDALPERRETEARLADRLRAHLADVRCLASYRAVGAEIDPLPMTSALARETRLALPRVTAESGSLLFHAWSLRDALVPGAFGIEEPRPDAPRVQPDVVLLPLIGFDRQGGRLGQGGGYYDRTLAAMPDAQRVGLAWSVQEVDAVPRKPWDIPLDAVLTEREWIVMPERTR